MEEKTIEAILQRVAAGMSTKKDADKLRRFIQKKQILSHQHRDN